MAVGPTVGGTGPVPAGRIGVGGGPPATIRGGADGLSDRLSSVGVARVIAVAVGGGGPLAVGGGVAVGCGMERAGGVQGATVATVAVGWPPVGATQPVTRPATRTVARARRTRREQQRPVRSLTARPRLRAPRPGAPAHTQPTGRDRRSMGGARRRGNRPADRRSPSPLPSGPRTPAGRHRQGRQGDVRETPSPHLPRPPSSPLTLRDMSHHLPVLLPWGVPAAPTGPPAPPACTASCSPPPRPAS